MLGPFIDSWHWIKSHNPGSPFKKRHLNFITIHYLYILSLAIVGSILIYPAGNLNYIDALFFASGSATQSGLNTVDINSLNTYQQHIAREARTLRHARTRSRTKTEAKDNPDVEKEAQGVRGRSIVVLHNNEGNHGTENGTDTLSPKKLEDSEATSASSSSQGDKSASRGTEAEAQLDQLPSLHREVTFADEVHGVGELKDPMQRLLPRQTAEEHIAFLEKQRDPKHKSTLRIPGPRDFDLGHVPETLAENEDGAALGHNMTSPNEDSMSASGGPIKRNVTIDEPQQPRQRAGTGLSKISFPPHRSNHIAHAKTTSPDGDEEEEKPPHSAWLKTRTGTFESLRHWVETDTFGSVVDKAGINRVWWGIFTPASLFNDLGFTLTPDSMISFQRAILPLLIGTFLIIIGNTGFPCMLRFIIWQLSKIIRRESGTWEELKFLLDHPRRCFTLLFPTDATAWLFWILVFLNGLDLILFIVLDLHDPVVTSIGNPGYRILNGLFQASSTRTAGFSVVNLAQLHPGIQVSYMVMMYISVFPIAISVRRTNVYEEKSLGIYTNGGENDDHANEPSYVGAHLRRQLSFDLWYIFLGLFIIAIAEGHHIQNTNEYAFTTYSCLFEIVSAYGTVGLSLGYPDSNTSFAGQFSVVSKLVIIAMQIRGRHRMLPYELDRAILLPSESLNKKEEADDARRLQRRNSSLSNLGPMGSGLHRQPTTPRETGQATSTGREQYGHAFQETDMGEHGHSGKAGSVVGKMMAGLSSGPHFKSREKIVPGHKRDHHIVP
ncbi:MAG: hypothetical protein Q9209_004636 [Squamulea sp. 1 TL-2023]